MVQDVVQIYIRVWTVWAALLLKSRGENAASFITLIISARADIRVKVKVVGNKNGVFLV